jgi:hypothetical protein
LVVVQGYGAEEAAVSQWSGKALSLRSEGQQQRLEFRQRTFNAALNELLQHPDWQWWDERTLSRLQYPADNAGEVAAAYAAWEVSRVAAEEARRQQKQQRQQAAAAAKAAAQPGWLQQNKVGLLRAAVAAVLGWLGWVLLKAWQSRPPVL